jgi:hypothetical protein
MPVMPLQHLQRRQLLLLLLLLMPWHRLQRSLRRVLQRTISLRR